MPNLSVIGELLAKEGVEFEYAGFQPECEPCKLKGVCHRLQEGRHYRVTAVRDVRHDCCTVFEGDVKVVEVEEVPLPVNIPAAATRGTAHTHKWEECGVPCPYKKHCDPAALSGGEKLQFEEVGDAPVVCKVGRDLRLAKVRVTD